MNTEITECPLCGSGLYTRETVDRVSPSASWTITPSGELIDWEDKYEGEDQNNELAFYCSNEHGILEMLAALPAVVTP